MASLFVDPLESLMSAFVAAAVLQGIKQRLAERKSSQSRKKPPPADLGPEAEAARRPTPLRPYALRLTPAQEANLIARGLPELLVRSGTLDYASLTSGSMVDRLRNGYA
jgi:hypothetical protein